MIKAVEAELSEIGLTERKEISICLAIDYIASTKIDSSFDYSTKIQSPMWATNMYTTHGQDAKVEHYLKPHFMDGYIKKDDYLYITTGSSIRQDIARLVRRRQLRRRRLRAIRLHQTTQSVAPRKILHVFPRRQAAQTIRRHHHHECSASHPI